MRDPVHRVRTWIDLLGGLYQILDAQDEAGAQKGEGKIIRRRTSFWSHVPGLRQKSSTDGNGATQVG